MHDLKFLLLMSLFAQSYIPQALPMNWVILYMMFTFCLSLMLVKLHFSSSL